MEPEQQAPSEIDEAAAFLTGDGAGGDADLGEESADDGIDPEADLEAEEAEEEPEEPEEDEEEAEEDDDEEGDEEKPPVVEKKKKPSHTDRLKRVIGQKEAEAQSLREERYTWAEVSNGLKLERDHYQSENQKLRAALEHLGYSETPEAAELREMQLREKTAAFTQQMSVAKQRAEAEYQAKLNLERQVDALESEAEKLASTHKIDAKFLMFQFVQGKMQTPLKDLAERMSGKKIAARNSTAKKQQQINKRAPNPSKVRRGRSAVPMKRPKPGDMDSYVNAAVADIERWRGGS